MPTFSDAMATITATPALVNELNDVLMGFTLSTCGKSEKDADEWDMEGHLQHWSKEPALGLKPELSRKLILR